MLSFVKRKDSSNLKFKKQFSRVSTAAQNSSNNNVPIRLQQLHLDQKSSMENGDRSPVKVEQFVNERLKSIEKINEERSQLVGLKNHAISSPNKTGKNDLGQDAFEVDLKVNNDFGHVPDLDQVDQLRSIGAVSMNNSMINQQSPLVTSS